MESVSPVIDGNEPFEVVYAADQPEYTPLPALRTEKALITRWRLSDEERQWIANGGDLFIAVLHFGQPLQPLMPLATSADEVMAILMDTASI